MQEAAWQRWIPLSGILFVILLLVGFVIMQLPMPDTPDSEITAFYEDSNNRLMVIIGAYFFAVAGLCLLMFANRLRRVIVEAEGPSATFASLVHACGAIIALAFMAAAASFAAVPGVMEFADAPAPGADVARYLPEVGGTLVFLGVMPAAVAMLGATAIASFRHSIFPAWFNWLSVACAIAVIFSALWIPAIAFLLWVLAGSVVLMQRQTAGQASTAAPQPA